MPTLVDHKVISLKVLRGKHHLVVLGGGGSLFDPVVELCAWLAARRRRHGDRGPLFCWPNGAPLTVDQVRAAVKRTMAAAGLNPDRFGAHSLRIGGATALFAAGADPTVIRTMGRWSSDIYRLYVRACFERCCASLAGRSTATPSRVPTRTPLWAPCSRRAAALLWAARC